MTLSPLAGDGAAAFGGELVEQEVAVVDAGVAAGIREQAERTVVAGVIVVLLGAEELAAEFQEVGGRLVGEVGLRLIVVLSGIGDGGGGADAGEAAAERNAAQP